MARRKTQPPLVLVTWEDAAQMDSETWVANEGKHRYSPQIHNQVGFLLADTAEGIVLTATWSPEMVSQRDSIPRGMVRSIQFLEPRAAAPASSRKKA